MKSRKVIVSILAAILVLALVFGFIASIVPTMVVPAYAKSSAEIEQELQALQAQKAAANEKLNGLKSQADANMSEIEKMVAEKDKIDQEIALLYEQIDLINQEIAAYNALIAEKQAELDAAMKRLAELQEQNKERIRAMEKNGKLSYWSVIFKANSFSDLLDRLKMVEEIAAADKERINQITAAAQEVSVAKEALETEKAKLEVVKQELHNKEAELQVKREEADKILNELIATGDEYLLLIEQAESERDAINKEIMNKEDEYEDALDREKPQPTTPPSNNNGGGNNNNGGGGGNSSSGWRIPMSYIAVTSRYGPRNTGIPGASTWHHGVDLAASTGTPIYATRSGVVTTSGWVGSGGNSVYIDHQDGYKSCYMHMTHDVVYVGQYVEQGQLIGYCGSTGVSSGPHLHFGIYYNGNSVNPANYIPI